MISATRGWLRRNRTPLAIGLGVAGAGYVATQYVLGKIADAKERMSGERLARENLRRRFEQNQEDCTFTVLALLPSVTENILAEMQTEEISYKIQQYRTGPSGAVITKSDLEDPARSEVGSDTPTVTDDDRSVASTTESGMHASRIDIPLAGLDGHVQATASTLSPQEVRKAKLSLWKELKISAITRVLTLLYTLSLLTIFTRVQLNILGRISYLSSVHGDSTTEPNPLISLHDNDSPTRTPPMPLGADFETNGQYLSFSWYLINRGWTVVRQRVEAAVHDVFDSTAVTESLDLARFAALIVEVRRRVEGPTSDLRRDADWRAVLLPTAAEEAHVLLQSSTASHDLAESERNASQGVIPSDDGGQSRIISRRLRALLDETADLIDSPSFTHVLTLLLDAGFSMLIENKLASLAFGITDTETHPPQIHALDGTQATGDSTSVPPTLFASKPIKLPKILAPLTRQAHVIGSSSSGVGEGNVYLKAMEAVGDLDALAAVIYAGPTQPARDDRAGAVTMQPPNSTDATTISEARCDVDGSSTVDVSQSVFESAWGKASATSAWEKSDMLDL